MSSLGKCFIWIDDERDVNWGHVPDGMAVVHCKTYKEAIEKLQFYMSYKTKLIVDFDHDLGCKKTGYDVAKWIVASGYPNVRFRVHSMNPVGAQNIREMLSHYGYEEIR